MIMHCSNSKIEFNTSKLVMTINWRFFSDNVSKELTLCREKINSAAIPRENKLHS